jgi:hypothetical protein
MEALPNQSILQSRLEILHLFMVDLLGRSTAAAKIFKAKFGEEFADSPVVSIIHKYAVAGLLIGLNAFFLYFILLRERQRGDTRQLQYLVCAAIEIVTLVAVFATTESLWLNYVVPLTVQREVDAAAAILTSVAEAAVSPQATSSGTSHFLNAPAHLFVSARVAKAHPQLLESLIVRSYSNHLPGQICKTWPHYQSAEERFGEVAVTRPTLVQSIKTGAARWAQECMAVSFTYQRILLRFAQPLAFAAVCAMWFSARGSPSAMAAIGAAFGVCAILVWCMCRTGTVARRAVAPTSAVLAPAVAAVAPPAAVVTVPEPQCADIEQGPASSDDSDSVDDSLSSWSSAEARSARRQRSGSASSGSQSEGESERNNEEDVEVPRESHQTEPGGNGSQCGGSMGREREEGDLERFEDTRVEVSRESASDYLCYDGADGDMRSSV